MKFEVGEVVMVMGSIGTPSLNGSECTILSGAYESSTYPNGEVLLCYDIGSPRGRIGMAERRLRKRPPKEDARKWFDEKIKVLEEA